MFSISTVVIHAVLRNALFFPHQITHLYYLYPTILVFDTSSLLSFVLYSTYLFPSSLKFFSGFSMPITFVAIFLYYFCAVFFIACLLFSSYALAALVDYLSII
uniref:Uncharacterized protein n=1 Tax=Cacopsylla melanoneura TaxID=428564 RepID=A0A8D8ZC05_9HEMI